MKEGRRQGRTSTVFRSKTLPFNQLVVHAARSPALCHVRATCSHVCATCSPPVK
jgi:hypothetical protein